jgi:hypothetical protein
MPALAQHSKNTPSWGSPPWLIDIGRRVLGHIDVDLATSEFWNRHGVQAPRWFDEQSDALREGRSWTGYGPAFCNPPGGLVREFWLLAKHVHAMGSPVFWVGFSVEQLSYLQRAGVMSPAYRRAIPPKRVAYMQHPRDYRDKLIEKAAKIHAKHGETIAWEKIHAKLDWLEREHGLDGSPLKGEQPTHSSWLLLMPTDAGQVERFDVEMRQLDAEVW